MKPILFSTPMVQAILEGRKTQTRREVKPQPIYHSDTGNWQFGKYMNMYAMYPELDIVFLDDCPYGQPGDVLWVKEEHKIDIWAGHIRIEFKDGTKHLYQKKELPLDTLHRIMRRKTLGQWQRARFLPKAMARIFLKITSVRVQRLQDITEADAIAEGVEMYSPGNWKGYGNDPGNFGSPISSFASLWQSINGPESWNQNPWVWAITFERFTRPESEIVNRKSEF